MSLSSRAGRALAISLSGLVTIAQPALADTDARQPQRTIVMQGEAQASANPDLAVVTGGTQVQARTAREAMEGNSKVMRAVQQALREAGIEERDVATSSLSLQPTIEYQQNTNRPRVVGYTAGHQLTIRVRDLTKLGDVLDRMVGAGANQVDSLQLTVSDWSKKLDEARGTAIADARRKAEILAKAAGARLGRVMHIQEQGSAPPRPMPRMAVAQARADSVPVATGDQNVQMAVTVTWELVD